MRTRRTKVTYNLQKLLLCALLLNCALYVIERVRHHRTQVIFGEALEAADAGRWYWDLENATVLWDDQMFRLFGQDKENWDPTYRGFESVLHPDDRQRVKDKVTRAILERGGYNDTFRVIRSDGSVVEIRASGLVSRDGTYMTGVNLPVRPREGNFLRERSETGSGLPYIVHYVHDATVSSADSTTRKGEQLPE